ncbi:MAG TPA: LamG-like jellyroll fold domain-containing protein [Sunxiuqinia sp.]|nr:LamG-like jellyroll fold domain-containing protein [Sunxiuqinia sp.]
MKFIKQLIQAIIIPLFFCVLSVSPLLAQQLAFPGAEGFGAYATGGRGGTVVHVTNLNESGAGSFADAVSQPNRIVVFDVGGVIPNHGIINVASNITIAGQTAPGGGITIYGNRIVVNGSNCIIRFIRMRGSINMSSGKCTLTCDNANNIIYDHCSVSWGRWDNIHIKDSKDITMQYCIIGEGIDPQRFGAITDGTMNWTVSHCLWIDNKSRNPKMKCYLQYINNVVYNYGNGIVGGHSAADHYQDVINNYFVAGPSASGNNYLSQWTSTDHLYSTGNYADINKDGVLNGMLVTEYDGATPMSSPKLTSPVPGIVQSAKDAFATVIADAGASIVRDTVDERLIKQVSSLGLSGAFIDSDADVGGPGIVANGTKALDTDNDGMPDAWELANGLNPNSSDPNGDINNNGYTNIEDYINYLGNTANIFRTPRVSATVVSSTEIDLSWTEAANSYSGFIIEKSPDNSNWTEIANVDSTVHSYEDTRLTPNTNYNYRIKVYSAADSSDYTVVSAKTEANKPKNSLPANGSSGLDSTKVNFSWNASSDATSFDFYFGTDSTNLSKVASGLTSETYALRGLDGNAKYFWRVNAVTPTGAFSSEIWSFTTRRIVPDNLVAWYAFDETSGDISADSSLYNNNGTVDMQNGNPVYDTGKVGNCLNLSNGTSSSNVSAPNASQIKFDTNSFSISFWMKIASPPADAYLIHKGSFKNDATQGTNGRWFGIESKGDNFRFAVDDDVTKTTVGTTSAGFCNGQWVHVVAVRDAKNKQLKLYRNGNLVGTTTDATGSIANSEKLYLANDRDLNAAFLGSIDEVKIFNYAVSQAEVTGLYTGDPEISKVTNLLPVNHSTISGQSVNLSWGSDSNSSWFNVYAGTDSTSLDLVAGNLTGNSYGLSQLSNGHYFWRIDNGNNSYAVKGDTWSFSTDGVSGVSEIGANGGNDEAAVYPNPTTGLLTVKLPKKSGKTHLTIENMNGAKIYDNTLAGSSQIHLDISGYTPGIYFLRASCGDRIISKTIIKK